MENSKINAPESFTEYLVLFLVFTCVLAGIIMVFVNRNFFSDVYVVEDGFIESLTVIALLSGAAVCLRRAVKLRSLRPPLFIMLTVLMGLMMLFGAGEEMSWGQRIFSIESADMFKYRNTQGEMNIHNLTLFGVKLNKLVFTNMLGVFAGVYILLLPVLYRKKKKFRSVMDSLGVPVPQPYQVWSVVLLVVMIGLTPSSKNSELLEFGGSFLFLLIVLRPYNSRVFCASIEKTERNTLR